MDWIQNLIKYSESSNAGNCPKCGSNNVEVEEHEHGGRKSLSFRCKRCNSADHFDGVITKKD